MSAFTVDRVLDIGARQLGNRVVRRITDRERPGRADFEPEQVFVEARRVGGRANLDVHILVAIRRARRVAAIEIQRERIAGVHPAPFDRLVTGGAFAQPLQRLLDRLVVDPARRPLERERRVVARLEGRDRVERRREHQRLAFLDRHVADVGRVDRLDAPLAQRLVDRRRNEVVGDVCRI